MIAWEIKIIGDVNYFCHKKLLNKFSPNSFSIGKNKKAKDPEDHIEKIPSVSISIFCQNNGKNRSQTLKSNLVFSSFCFVKEYTVVRVVGRE